MFRKKKKKQNNALRGAHIKHNTEGAYNELSFSVLDAAKNAADAEERGAKTEQGATFLRFGTIPLFTLRRRGKTLSTPQKDDTLPLSEEALAQQRNSSQTGSYPLTPEPTLPVNSAIHTSSFKSSSSQASSYVAPLDEIARRKARRRLRNGIMIVAVVLCVAGLVSAGVGFMMREYQNHQDTIGLIAQAVETISEADDVLVAMDALVNSELTTEDIGTAQDMIERAAEVTELLDSAEAAADAAAAVQSGTEVWSGSDEEALNRVYAAISARRTIIDQGIILLNEAILAREATDAITAAWDEVLAADGIARQASALVVDSTEENVQESRELSVQAQEAFITALEHLEEAQLLYPETDYSSYIEYVELRISAMDYAIASDDAILAYDRDAAVSNNDIYNELEAEAAELINTLPEDPTDLIREVYENNVSESSRSYTKARSTAATADSFLRDYLG